jgi:hypothetical protein
MIVQPKLFDIPPDIAAGLASGELVQFGGIVRNQLGQIHKHLKEANSQAKTESALARAAAVAKNRPGLVVISLTLAAGAAVVVPRVRTRWNRRRVPESVRRYNDSLIAYLEAVRRGQLDVAKIDRLIADLDSVLADAAGKEARISLDLSLGDVEVLLGVVSDYTKSLVEINAVELDPLEAQAAATGADDELALRRQLRIQRAVFDAA